MSSSGLSVKRVWSAEGKIVGKESQSHLWAQFGLNLFSHSSTYPKLPTFEKNIPWSDCKSGPENLSSKSISLLGDVRLVFVSCSSCFILSVLLGSAFILRIKGIEKFL